MLAVFVDRRFLINETIAFAFYSALLVLVIRLGRPPPPSNPHIEELQPDRQRKR